ncbi:MAG: methylenetetrahydrofolate reductase [NAD(P)H] [Xanthomonadales bacterium]|nr:methylenetetrahydrofolate reductase [NAD(P)H] [Xanthomonadales bacterium]
MASISLEFYPPKTDDQRRQLDRAAGRFKALSPEYVSVTFGAGGSTLDYTADTVAHLHGTHGFDAAPHLSCVGGTRAQIAALLDRYHALGCKRIVALRGDLPSGMAVSGDFRYANELVAFIREHCGDLLRVEVACYPETHPQAADANSDLANLKRKIDAGADGAISQYFYNPDAYFRFVDDARKLGIDVPIVAGIMPIANFSQLRRFSELCGAEIPRWISQRMHCFGDDVRSLREFGADVVAALCQRLIDGGVPGLHFYTLNLSQPTLAVLERLDALPAIAAGTASARG